MVTIKTFNNEYMGFGDSKISFDKAKTDKSRFLIFDQNGKFGFRNEKSGQFLGFNKKFEIVVLEDFDEKFSLFVVKTPISFFNHGKKCKLNFLN